MVSVKIAREKIVAIVITAKTNLSLVDQTEKGGAVSYGNALRFLLIYNIVIVLI